MPRPSVLATLRPEQDTTMARRASGKWRRMVSSTRESTVSGVRRPCASRLSISSWREALSRAIETRLPRRMLTEWDRSAQVASRTSPIREPVARPSMTQVTIAWTVTEVTMRAAKTKVSFRAIFQPLHRERSRIQAGRRAPSCRASVDWMSGMIRPRVPVPRCRGSVLTGRGTLRGGSFSVPRCRIDAVFLHPRCSRRTRWRSCFVFAERV